MVKLQVAEHFTTVRQKLQKHFLNHGDFKKCLCPKYY